MIVEDTDTMNSGFKFTCTIGNSEPFEMYKGTGSVITYEKGIKAVENGSFKITPKSDFTGTIKNISVKEIIGTVAVTFKIKNSQKQNVFEIRPSKLDLNNIFEGKNVGRYNTCGYENVIMVDYAFENNVSGFWNTLIGYKTGQNNINGSRLIGLGYMALNAVISGHRDIAIGTFSQSRNKYGTNDISIGADSLWMLEKGDYNICMGTTVLDHLIEGNGNVLIGYKDGSGAERTSFMTGIGHQVLQNNKAHNITAIGALALQRNVDGTGQTVVGYKGLNLLESGINNTGIGDNVLALLSSGSGNMAGGKSALFNLITGNYNVAIGNDAGRNVTEGTGLTLIGRGTGATLTKGTNVILIGNGVDVPNAETSDYLNIGKLIYGDLANKKIGIGIPDPLARLHIGAGTASVPPIRINSGVLLSTPMNGAIESDGSFLYFTNSAGTRLKIQATPA